VDGCETEREKGGCYCQGVVRDKEGIEGGGGLKKYGMGG